ncbi:sugar transferase [Actinomycetes bacterium KLBMP 9797]
MNSASVSVGNEPTAELPIVGRRHQPAAANGEPTVSAHGANGAHVPAQRTAEAVVDPQSVAPTSGITAVLPYAGSSTSGRTRGLRAWMITAPVDVAALLAPLLVTDRYWRGTLTAAGLTVVVFAVGGLYNARRHLSILDELPSLCGRLFASAAIVSIVAAMRHDSVGYGAGFMRGVALSAGLVIVGRAITRTMVVVARKRRWVEHNAVIIGSGPIAIELARLLRRYPRYGLRFAGCVDAPAGAKGHAENGAEVAPPPMLGALDDLEDLLTMVECEVIIVADTRAPEPMLNEILSRPSCAKADLWVVPRLWGSRALGRLPDHIGAVPIVQIRDTTLSGPRSAVKRLSDVVFASLALILLSPVFVLCAIATFLEGGRGIFFRQERIGRHGQPFEVIKFRSMRPASDAESQTNWSIADDRRVGPVGRFLRRTSLDELPQLWNILRGDMTVVGPRPERPYFVERFSAEYADYAMRHRVPVGLTGLAQVSGLRGDTPISDRARFDNYYIENWSLWLDVKVLLRTIAEVFRGGGR